MLEASLKSAILKDSFCQAYNDHIGPYLQTEHGYKLFGKPPRPHKKLNQMFCQFMERIKPPYSGSNFLEIGSGAGGISYFAKRLRFDVISTDTDQSAFPKAWKASRDFLDITSSFFVVSTNRSIHELLSFKDGRAADYIYMDGVPFNKSSSDGKSTLVKNDSWFELTEWLSVLTDIYHNLNPGGQFMNYLVFGMTEQLAKNINSALLAKLGRSCHFYVFFHSSPMCPTVDIIMRKSKA